MQTDIFGYRINSPIRSGQNRFEAVFISTQLYQKLCNIQIHHKGAISVLPVVFRLNLLQQLFKIRQLLLLYLNHSAVVQLFPHLLKLITEKNITKAQKHTLIVVIVLVVCLMKNPLGDKYKIPLLHVINFISDVVSSAALSHIVQLMQIMIMYMRHTASFGSNMS